MFYSKRERACITLAMLAIVALLSFGRDQQFTQVYAQEEYESPVWFKFGFWATPGWTLQPWIPEWSGLCWTQALFSEPLAVQLMNGTLIPRLATSWEYDPYTGNFTVRLRQGVIWHDGKTEFQSEDVLNYHTANSMYYYPPTAIPLFDKIYTPDNYTVVYHIANPYPGFEADILQNQVGSHWMRNGPLYRFCNETVRRWLSENNTEHLDKLKQEYTMLKIKDPSLVLGTGIFKLSKVAEDMVVLEKWSKHWLADNVKYKGFVVYLTKTEDIKDAMFLHGDVDGVYIITKETARVGRSRPEEFVIRIGISWWLEGLVLDTRVYPLSAKEVRQAMAYAINGTEVTEYIFGRGPAYDGVSLYPGQVSAYLTRDSLDRLHKYNQGNIGKANELLDGIGFIDRDGDGVRETPNGTKLEFDTLTVSEWTDMTDLCDYAATVCSKIEIKLNVIGVSYSVWTEKMLSFKYPISFGWAWFKTVGLGFHDMYSRDSWIYGGIAYYPEIVEVPSWVDPTAGTANITKLTRDLMVTMDLEEQERITKILVWYTNEYVPWIWTGIYGRGYGFSARIKGIEKVPDFDPTLFASGCDVDVPAFFIREGLWAPKLKLEISAVGGGTTNPSAGTYTYTTNETLTVTAAAASGFTFDHWELDGKIVGRELTYTVTMDDEHVLTPIFTTMAVAPVPYELYAVIAVFAVLMVAGWVLALMWRRRMPPKA